MTRRRSMRASMSHHEVKNIYIYVGMLICFVLYSFVVFEYNMKQDYDDGFAFLFVGNG